MTSEVVEWAAAEYAHVVALREDLEQARKGKLAKVQHALTLLRYLEQAHTRMRAREAELEKPFPEILAAHPVLRQAGEHFTEWKAREESFKLKTAKLQLAMREGHTAISKLATLYSSTLHSYLTKAQALAQLPGTKEHKEESWNEF